MQTNTNHAFLVFVREKDDPTIIDEINIIKNPKNHTNML